MATPTTTTEQRKIHSWRDLRAGDAVMVWVRGVWHDGVIDQLRSRPPKRGETQSPIAMVTYVTEEDDTRRATVAPADELLAAFAIDPGLTEPGPKAFERAHAFWVERARELGVRPAVGPRKLKPKGLDEQRRRDTNLAAVEAFMREVGRPVSVPEIVAGTAGKLATKSRQPRDVIARDLVVHMRHHGERSRFVRVALGRYTLRDLLPRAEAAS